MNPEKQIYVNQPMKYPFYRVFKLELIHCNSNVYKIKTKEAREIVKNISSSNSIQYFNREHSFRQGEEEVINF